jgi:ketosteroid isomerase-like protein
VRYADPLRYSFRGRDALRAFFEDDGGHAQRCVFHTILFDEEQQTGAVEYTYEGTHRYHGVVLVRVQEGRISHWREYQHIDAREWEELAAGTAF